MKMDDLLDSISIFARKPSDTYVPESVRRSCHIDFERNDNRPTADNAIVNQRLASYVPVSNYGGQSCECDSISCDGDECDVAHDCDFESNDG